MWTHKGLDLAPHPVIVLALQIGDVEKFPQAQALGFEGLVPFVWVCKQGPTFTATEKDGGDKRFVELEFACEADAVAPSAPIQSGHCCHC